MKSKGLDEDTIAAIATPPGRGGIGIVRVSGSLVQYIASKVTGRIIEPKHPTLTSFIDANGEIIDKGFTLFFPKPASFTGEDIVEFHGHGGVVVTEMVLDACIFSGARLARPGEFSERAFLNDKLDLAQAEALADLIDARTKQAVKRASATLRGAFSSDIEEINQTLINIRVYVEATIDFPEEDLGSLKEDNIREQLQQLSQQMKSIVAGAKQGAIINHGALVVLTGKPNAGKSSLMNRLARENVAIVTNEPGTTRDVIRKTIDLHGVPIQLSDTAGIRAGLGEVEKEGVRRARCEISEADLLIEVIDDSETNFEWTEYDGKIIRAYNKIDLSGRSPGAMLKTSITEIAVSATTGEGIQQLEKSILDVLGINELGAESKYSVRERHVAILDSALTDLAEAITHFDTTAASELLAEDLRRTHEKLESLTGAFGSEDILGEIFSSFCIGK